MTPFDEARSLIRLGLETGAYPAAAIEVGRLGGPIWQEPFGTDLSMVFDLASLTKVIATTSLTMRAVGEGSLRLDMPLAQMLADCNSREHAGILFRHLLDHSSGLPAHVKLFEHAHGREAFQAAICALPLEREAGVASVYSDLGFMLLGFLLEDISGRPLDAEFDGLALAGDDVLRFLPPAGLIDRIAPTEHDPWRGRMLRGEVHDENAAALGGVAGHAGLFGTVTAVGSFARTVLATFRDQTVIGSPEVMKTFAARSHVPGSSRALGWDTMKPTSSCGTLMSPTSIGHTGYTGTSLWIDHERDLYVALLTNRVHPSRKNEALTALRPQIHDAILKTI